MIDVLVIGGGPAGLTAATELRRLGIDSVVVLEREPEAGGIPRHSHHTGYGIRDRRRVLSGPVYAAALVNEAQQAGVDIRTCAMVTDWSNALTVGVTSPSGREQVTARAIVLATGARERPRAARRVPGDRPAGVFTTGQLQDAVHIHHQPIGTRAVIVGAESVSWSAVLTLRSVGCRTVEMTTEYERGESFGAFTLAGRVGLGVSVATSTRVVRIIGRDRVTGVEVEHRQTGARRVIECDTVVFTGDWIPDNELARMRGLELDHAHLGPIVDTSLRTSAEGIFAAGNLLHPVDTADVAAIDGRHVAAQVARHLQGLGDSHALAAGIRLLVEPPLRWIAPSIVRPGDPAPPRNRLLLWSDAWSVAPKIAIRQGGVVLADRRLGWPMAPGRAFRIPWNLLASLDPSAGDVVISVS